MKTLREAEEEHDELLASIQMIEAQLSDKKGKDNVQQWRSKATYALNKKLEKFRQLKRYIKDKRAEINRSKLNPDGDLVQESYVLLTNLHDQGFHFDDDEWALIHALQDHCERNL